MLKFFKKMFAPTTDNNLIDALQNETFLVDDGFGGKEKEVIRF